MLYEVITDHDEAGLLAFEAFLDDDVGKAHFGGTPSSLRRCTGSVRRSGLSYNFV